MCATKGVAVFDSKFAVGLMTARFLCTLIMPAKSPVHGETNFANHDDEADINLANRGEANPDADITKGNPKRAPPKHMGTSSCRELKQLEEGVYYIYSSCSVIGSLAFLSANVATQLGVD